jgi:hypothetical protein
VERPTTPTPAQLQAQHSPKKPYVYLFPLSSLNLTHHLPQQQNFASNNTIITSISSNTSTLTIPNISGSNAYHWISFYYQNTDDMGYGDQPGGSADRIKTPWALRRISSVVVNGEVEKMQTLYQRDTHKGVILSTPLKVWLRKGENSITVGGLDNGVDFKGADLDRIVVYPAEK